ncbi:HAD-IC family P-type ATPase [Nocardiopsis sp. YSL2]|uniref:cation-translocating P-type ATPase n=1 Tax=Nocardiopsis sp. YSL2 TaxID=2939492 RepID=UPI0026F42F97|nr:HAD-IC family P-type ATPase [Nocardiopsis sp. YSL2]
MATSGSRIDEAWHVMGPQEAIEALDTSPQGLAGDEAARRLVTYGPNALRESAPPSVPRLLVRQFVSPLIAILLAAAFVTFVLGEWIDTGVIVAVLLFNAGIGFVQERRADTAVRALRKLAVPRARVLRDGTDREVDGRDLVPGDVVLLESGVRVPADLRLIRAQALRIDESPLTGESAPVTKHTRALDRDLAVGDLGSLAHSGTMVTSGRGEGVVFATGRSTRLGGIADLIETERQPETPLNRHLRRLARLIMVVVLVACALVLVLGLINGGEPRELFLAAVALAVAAIPEGLPIVLTIALAIGVTRMARGGAIVRHLRAVETLGSATVIGADKTGTLTENRMTVRRLWAGGRERDLERPDPARPASVDAAASPLDLDPLVLALVTGVLTNEAAVEPGGDGGVGDPTEIALLRAASRAGLEPEPLRDAFGLVADVPFEPAQQYSASLRHWGVGGGAALFVKGSPERVAAMCDSVHGEGEGGDGAADPDLDAVREAAHAMAGTGLRVLALAVGRSRAPGDTPIDLEDPRGLVFVGLVGLVDPPRAGVREAVRACHAAGVRVLMITGDHALTARAIAAELDIADGAGPAVTGAEVDAMDDAALSAALDGTTVFARVSPEGKLRIVRALQECGETVAVTGDGVNDAPALKAASIGVSMGRAGTDVAREASEIVLTDDDFTSIVRAVELGRVTFENVRRATFFLVSTAVATILALIVSVAAGWPLLMLPAQLLWLNLVTNGLQDVALVFERGDRDVLRRAPRAAQEGILSPLMWRRTVLTGLVQAVGAVALFAWALEDTGSATTAQTVALTTLVLFAAFQAGNARSQHRSVLSVPLRDNRFLVVATAATLALHAAALYFPPTRFVLRVEPLPLEYWPVMVAVAASVLVAVEAEKALRRWAGRAGRSGGRSATGRSGRAHPAGDAVRRKSV